MQTLYTQIHKVHCVIELQLLDLVAFLSNHIKIIHFEKIFANFKVDKP